MRHVSAHINIATVGWSPIAGVFVCFYIKNCRPKRSERLMCVESDTAARVWENVYILTQRLPYGMNGVRRFHSFDASI